MPGKSAVLERARGQILTDSVSHVVASFLIERSSRGLSKATLFFYERYLKEFCDWLDRIDVINLDDLTPDLLRRYLLHLEESGHNPGGVHCYYRCIRAFLGWWESESDGQYRSPMAKVKPPSVQIKPLPGIQLVNVMYMVSACDNHLGFRDQAIFLVLTDTGARRAELLSLNVGDIDLNTGEVLIRRAKGGKFRSVFLGSRSRKVLKRYLKTRDDLRPESALFTTCNEKRLTFDGLKSIVRRRAADAGIHAPGLHDFRRCFALSMARNGADIVTISRMLGHSSLEVTKRYLAQDASDFKKAHEKFGPIDNAA